MPGVVEYLVGCTDFDDFSGIHDGDAVGQAGYDTQIMGNEKDRQAHDVAQVFEQIEDLHLHCHIEGRRRFISQEDVR